MMITNENKIDERLAKSEESVVTLMSILVELDNLIDASTLRTKVRHTKSGEVRTTNIKMVKTNVVDSYESEFNEDDDEKIDEEDGIAPKTKKVTSSKGVPDLKVDFMVEIPMFGEALTWRSRMIR